MPPSLAIRQIESEGSECETMIELRQNDFSISIEEAKKV